MQVDRLSQTRDLTLRYRNFFDSFYMIRNIFLMEFLPMWVREGSSISSAFLSRCSEMFSHSGEVSFWEFVMLLT